MTTGHRRVSRVVVAAVLSLVAITTTSCGSDSNSDAGRFPDVALVGSDGQTVSTASLTGTPLVVNFWYSTCAPCAKELGDFASVHAAVGDEVRFIGVNPLDSVGTMTAFATDRGVRYELYRDELAELQEELGLVSFPVTLFVRADGTILDQTGPLDAVALRAHVDELLAEGGS